MSFVELCMILFKYQNEVESCLKRALLKKEANIWPLTMTFFSIALQFNRTERLGGEANYQGADCIRVIMIFTDGGTSSEEAIFAARNRYPFKVRRELF